MNMKIELSMQTILQLQKYKNSSNGSNGTACHCQQLSNLSMKTLH